MTRITDTIKAADAIMAAWARYGYTDDEATARLVDLGFYGISLMRKTAYLGGINYRLRGERT